MLSSSSLLTISAILVVSLGIRVNGQAIAGSPLFVGCVDDTYYPDDSYDVGAFDDPESCASWCFDLSQHFMYSAWTLVPQDINRCYCSNTFPSSTQIQPGTDSDGGCDATTQSYIHITSSTFNLIGCKSTLSTGFEVIVASPQVCVSSCINTGFAFFSPQANGYRCSCGEATDVGPQAVNCGPGVWSTFQHNSGSFVAGPSGFVKRQQQLERKRRLDKINENQYCPSGLKACKVPGDDLAFECINTDDELESCGGCLHGTYGIENNAIGVDCTTLPGVAMGAITCSAGQCTAFACEEGYELGLNSTCISLF